MVCVNVTTSILLHFEFRHLHQSPVSFLVEIFSPSSQAVFAELFRIADALSIAAAAIPNNNNAATAGGVCVHEVNSFDTATT